MPRLFFAVLVVCASLRAQTAVVLPFFNHSKAGNLDWIGESIADSISDSLDSEGMLVLGREDRLEAYRRESLRPGAELTHASIIKIGQALDAARVIYGYYEVMAPEPGKDQLKSSLRITARILDLKNISQGSPFGETGALEDLAPLEAHLGWQVLQQLEPRTAPSEQEFLKARPPVRIDAVENYIRGLLSASPEQRHRFFTQAVRLDEHYSQPSFQLGKIAWEQKDYKGAAGWLERVARSDGRYFEAQFFLGLCRYHLGDYAAAVKALQGVAAAYPLNEVYDDLGAAQERAGDSAGAIASFQKALEGDDADPDYHFNLAYVYWQTGQFDVAEAGFRDVLTRTPNDSEAAAFLARAAKKEGPVRGDPKMEGRERLKTTYEETAYRELQAELKKK